MKQRLLGANGPSVSAIGFGTLSFGGIYGPTSAAESLATLDAAWEAGITLFDTANVYGTGLSETLFGQWLARTGHRPHIATKAGIARHLPGGVDNSPAHLRSELEGSLRRLGLDHVTLFYAHRHDPAVPAEDLAGTMQRLIDEGKILGYGLSEVSPGTVERAHAVQPVMAVQNEYSLWTRLPELGLLQLCARLGIAFVPFSPLARGCFGTPLPDPTAFAEPDMRIRMPRFQPDTWPHNCQRLAAFHSYAETLGVTPAALSLAWLLDRGAHLIPIPGTRSPGHLSAWAGADAIALTDEIRQEIDRLLPVGWAWGDRYHDAMSATAERYC